MVVLEANVNTLKDLNPVVFFLHVESARANFER